MKVTYSVFSPFFKLYYRFFDLEKEVCLARQCKRIMKRGDDLSEEHIKAYKKYKDHPMVKNYKW